MNVGRKQNVLFKLAIGEDSSKVTGDSQELLRQSLLLTHKMYHSTLVCRKSVNWKGLKEEGK